LALAYFIDSVRRVVFIRGWGIVSDGQIREGTRVMLGDPRYDPSYARLADFRDVTQWTVHGESVRESGSAMSKESPARRATVVNDGLAFGLARMSQLSSDSPSDLSLVCRDLPSALAWLGLAPTTSWPADPPDYVTSHDTNSAGNST
jgi:hypothetical protein